jgi:hypothetical protein
MDFGRLVKQHVPSHCYRSPGDLAPWNELGLGLAWDFLLLSELLVSGTCHVPPSYPVHPLRPSQLSIFEGPSGAHLLPPASVLYPYPRKPLRLTLAQTRFDYLHPSFFA